MQLLVFAHKAEASAFIEHFSMSETSTPNLYLGGEQFVLITGEGVYEALMLTSYVLGKINEISDVINLGAAGALNTNLKLGSIHLYRQVFLTHELKPQFKSFKTKAEIGPNLVSSDQRILENKQKVALRTMADMVDREAWGVAYASHRFQKNLWIIKYLSDYANLDECNLVKENAEKMSQALLDYYLSLTINEKKEIKQNSDHTVLSEFYFTVAQNHELNSLLKKVSLIYEKDQAQILSELPLEAIQAQSPLKKIRTKLLLEHLREIIDPITAKEKAKKKKLTQYYQADNLKLAFDEKLEDPSLKIEMKVRNVEEFERLSQQLKHFPWDNF